VITLTDVEQHPRAVPVDQVRTTIGEQSNLPVLTNYHKVGRPVIARGAANEGDPRLTGRGNGMGRMLYLPRHPLRVRQASPVSGRDQQERRPSG
jgi:hypothetical protein